MKNAKNPLPVTPQPEKYFTASGNWSKDIKKAFIYRNMTIAKLDCQCKRILNYEDRIKPHKDGFIITKPATI